MPSQFICKTLPDIAGHSHLSLLHLSLIFGPVVMGDGTDLYSLITTGNSKTFGNNITVLRQGHAKNMSHKLYISKECQTSQSDMTAFSCTERFLVGYKDKNK